MKLSFLVALLVFGVALALFVVSINGTFSWKQLLISGVIGVIGFLILKYGSE